MKNFLGNLISGIRKEKGVDMKKLLEGYANRTTKSLEMSPVEICGERWRYEDECEDIMNDDSCCDEEVIWRLMIALERHILHSRALLDPDECAKEFQQIYLSYMEKNVTDQWVAFDPNHPIIQKRVQDVRDFFHTENNALMTRGLCTIINIMKAKNIAEDTIARYVWEHMEQHGAPRELIDALVFSKKLKFWQ